MCHITVIIINSPVWLLHDPIHIANLAPVDKFRISFAFIHILT